MADENTIDSNRPANPYPPAPENPYGIPPEQPAAPTAAPGNPAVPAAAPVPPASPYANPAQPQATPAQAAPAQAPTAAPVQPQPGQTQPPFAAPAQPMQGQPQPTYNPPGYNPPPYAPAKSSSKYFPLAVAGLILAILGLAVPGLICAIIALVMWGKEKKQNPAVASDTKTQVISIIAIAGSAVWLVIQIAFFGLVMDIVNNPEKYDVTSIEQDAYLDDDLDLFYDSSSAAAGALGSSGTSDADWFLSEEATAAFEGTDDDMRFVAPGTASVLDSAQAQVVGIEGLGMMELPADWADFNNLDNPEGTAVSKCDPNSAYESPTYGTTEYASVAMIDYYDSDKELAYDTYCLMRTYDSDLSNVKAKEVSVNGHDAILLVSDFPADGKVLYEYFIDIDLEGACCYVFLESKTENAATVSSYINSFKLN